MTHVLVAEDDPAIQRLLCTALELEGMHVHVVSDGRDVVREADLHSCDLVLLDLTLPGRDGLDILEDLNRSRGVPVIVVSGRDAEGDRVLGLNLGADDFVAKPFSSRELVARVQSVLRRARRGTPERIEHGGLHIDVGTREVTVDGREIVLTRLEFDLLLLFAMHPRRAWTRDELLQAVWRSSERWQGAATVTEIVRRVRAKLQSQGSDHEWIRTVRGVGYRFEPPS